MQQGFVKKNSCFLLVYLMLYVPVISVLFCGEFSQPGDREKKKKKKAGESNKWLLGNFL